MNRGNSLALAMFVAFACIDSLGAQQRDSGGELVNALLSELHGTWQPVEVIINGRTTKELPYGPSIFEGNTWTMQTTNGDHVYELSSVNEKADPIEITFVEKVAKRSFVGLLSLENEMLTIARGMQWNRDEAGNYHIPRPDSLTPGGNKIVYSWKRAPNSAERANRPSLSIRLYDDGKPEKILADHTIQAFFGGKLEYVSGAQVDSEIQARSQAFGRQADNPIMLGTRITGSIENTRNGETRVFIEVQLGNAVSTDDPVTAIVRSESLVLQTTLKPKEKKRINCGGNRWCDLVLQ